MTQLTKEEMLAVKYFTLLFLKEIPKIRRLPENITKFLKYLKKAAPSQRIYDGTVLSLQHEIFPLEPQQYGNVEPLARMGIPDNVNLPTFSIFFISGFLVNILKKDIHLSQDERESIQGLILGLVVWQICLMGPKSFFFQSAKYTLVSLFKLLKNFFYD